MITLPNGDHWIIDESELEAVNKQQVRPEDLSETGQSKESDFKDFIQLLLHPSEDSCHIPRKLTNQFDGYWDCNFNAVVEILSDVAYATVKTDFFTACEMPWGEVHVIYSGADSGGYEVETKVVTFKDREEYNQAVSFSYLNQGFSPV